MLGNTLRLVAFGILLSVMPVHAASDGKYQFTGIVTAVEGDTFTVKKSDKEIWTFFAEAGKAKAKVGDKVTVFYKMQVQSIEIKPAKKAK